MGHTAASSASKPQLVQTVEQLRVIVGVPIQRVADKVADRLSSVHREWIARSPWAALATTDSGGNLDVSPKGDTLRINGTARIVCDADYFDDMIVKGNRPILALEVRVEEVFFHCTDLAELQEHYRPENYSARLYRS
ncbi:hypothetical protein [Williamsia sp. CHRR-6]|uniref:hypothetical protein n=1 Tax=Williamsia sp. CHRR-6 TaxID=2835871 RepID=UPI001BDAF8AC|nr:hypothetical protein [Williamsia sp. CHRR-6]MBT0566681.1 hypothetical protein [Williamsia sp. CHRR-6]